MHSTVNSEDTFPSGCNHIAEYSLQSQVCHTTLPQRKKIIKSLEGQYDLLVLVSLCNSSGSIVLK